MTRAAVAWNQFWFHPSQPYALAASRIVVAWCALLFLLGGRWPSWPIVNWSALGALNLERRYSTYADNDPTLWAPTSFLDLFNLPPPSQTVLTVAFTIAFVGAWFLLIGLGSRIAAVATGGSLLYLLAMVNSWGKVNHGYHVLGLALLILAFSRCGDAWSLDLLIKRKNPGIRGVKGEDAAGQYTWPVVAMQISYALMFFFAGWNKLIKSGWEWAFSENMRNTLIFQNMLVRDWEEASWAVRFVVELDHPLVWYGLGAGALLSELFLVAIVFFRSMPWIRRALLASGVMLVVSLDLMMQLPNPVLLALLLVFVDWNRIRQRLVGPRGHELQQAESGEAAASPVHIQSSVVRLPRG